MPGWKIAVLVLGLGTGAGETRSQRVNGAISEGTLVGATVGPAFYGAGPGFVVTAHPRPLIESGLGTAFAVGWFPAPVGAGIVILMPEIGPVWSRNLSHSNLSFRGGLTMIMAGGSTREGSTFGAAAGLHLGTGVVTRVGNGAGIPVEAGGRWFPFDRGFGLVSLEVGIAALPRDP